MDERNGVWKLKKPLVRNREKKGEREKGVRERERARATRSLEIVWYLQRKKGHNSNGNDSSSNNTRGVEEETLPRTTIVTGQSEASSRLQHHISPRIHEDIDIEDTQKTTRKPPDATRWSSFPPPPLLLLSA